MTDDINESVVRAMRKHIRYCARSNASEWTMRKRCRVLGDFRTKIGRTLYFAQHGFRPPPERRFYVNANAPGCGGHAPEIVSAIGGTARFSSQRKYSDSSGRLEEAFSVGGNDFNSMIALRRAAF
jgi:hypothetical protein